MGQNPMCKELSHPQAVYVFCAVTRASADPPTPLSSQCANWGHCYTTDHQLLADHCFQWANNGYSEEGESALIASSSRPKVNLIECAFESIWCLYRVAGG